MALDLRSSQNLYEEAGRIDLSHAIQTLLGDDKENDDLSLQLLTCSSTVHNTLDSSSSINKTPHDSCLDKAAARQHCRKLENGDTTPKRKQEPRRHLNSVNILCRSKKRKLENRSRYSDSSKPLALDGSKNARLVASGSGRFGPLQTLHDSNVQIVNMGPSGNAGIMVKDSSGKLYPAEFVPVMVEARNGGFFMSPNNNSLNNNQGVLNYQESRGNGQDDSLTNITWLKRMSAPGVDSEESSEPCQLQFPDPECERPPYSYSALIQFALISTPAGKMTLKDIYEWIQTNFPFFKTAKLGWKNSIRHNLSLHKIFIREPPGELGKPAFWTLRPGTVVRLPENRLFVMENKGDKTNGARGHAQNPMAGKVCIKQADGTTEFVSEQFLQAPAKPKPILPRCSAGYTFLTMVPGCQLERSGKKARYAKIAPKQTSHPVYHLSVPPTSVGSNLNSPEETVPFQTPQRRDSCMEERPERVKGSQGEDEKRDRPVMSTPLRPSRSELMETMGSLTPFNDDDYTLLRSQADILNITPIKGSGMTPVIKGILSQTNDLDDTPARPTQSRQSLLTTPVVDRDNISFNLDDLFGTADRNDELPDDFQNCSFSQLFSPVSKK